MPKTIEIKKSELDRDFRRKIRGMLDSAQREIVIITGEGAAFGFQDLRLATERAIERGVKVKIYARSPIPKLLNKVVMLGCQVHVGKEIPKNHFLVVDGRDWVISREHLPGEIGKRRGEIHLNDRKGAKRVLADFRRLIRRAELARTPAWELDPLMKAIKAPLSWGVKTNSRGFREELFG